MQTAAIDKAQKKLAQLIREELRAHLESARGPKSFTNLVYERASQRIAADLAHDSRFLDCVSSLRKSQVIEWITTEDAARMSGFSRPFIAALWDSEAFSGKVTRTEKGHRRMNREVFQQWMDEHREGLSKEMPQSLEDARSGLLLTKAPAEKELADKVDRTSAQQNKVRASSRKAALARAAEMGLG